MMAEKKRRRSKLWPMKGEMIGVHPKQVKEAQARLKALGAPGTYDPNTGDLIIKSRKDYREFCKRTGRVNRDAGYGDWPGTDGDPNARAEIRDRLAWARRKGRLT
jgi:hypothetical protein